MALPAGQLRAGGHSTGSLRRTNNSSSLPSPIYSMISRKAVSFHGSFIYPGATLSQIWRTDVNTCIPSQLRSSQMQSPYPILQRPTRLTARQMESLPSHLLQYLVCAMLSARSASFSTSTVMANSILLISLSQLSITHDSRIEG